MMREVKLSEDNSMVSFDVKSLFTNVPVDEALEVVHKELMKDDTLMDRTGLPPQKVTCLLELCLQTTYISSSRDLNMNRRMELP